MQALRRIWENAHLAAKRSFDSPQPVPPELPPVPSSYRAWRCVSWTGFALFHVPWESGTGVSQRKGASSFPSAGALPWRAEGWELPGARAWVCKHHPRESRCKPMGTSHQPCTPRLHIYPCVALGSPRTAPAGAGEASGQQDLLPPSPGTQTPSCGQEMGRLVQLLFLTEGHTDTGRCAGTCLASLQPPTSTSPTAGLGLGVGTVPHEPPVARPPHALAQGPRDEFWYSRARAAALSSEQPWPSGASQGHGLNSPLAKHISLSQPGW